MENGHRVTKDEVIAKLKDDGDFDRLRLKIIRRLKDKEELRDKIISVVKQSAALNRPGAENLKPRQLSDSIYEEIKGEVTGHISEGLWGIIQSPDGMKTEITDTVQSVYNKLVDPNGTQMRHSMMQETISNQQAVSDNGAVSNSDPKEPPGFYLTHNHGNKELSHLEQREAHGERASSEDLKDNRESAHNVLPSDFADMSVPPSSTMPDENRKLSDSDDEDPALPPGFG